MADGGGVGVDVRVLDRTDGDGLVTVPDARGKDQRRGEPETAGEWDRRGHGHDAGGDGAQSDGVDGAGAFGNGEAVGAEHPARVGRHGNQPDPRPGAGVIVGRLGDADEPGVAELGDPGDEVAQAERPADALARLNGGVAGEDAGEVPGQRDGTGGGLPDVRLELAAVSQLGVDGQTEGAARVAVEADAVHQIQAIKQSGGQGLKLVVVKRQRGQGTRPGEEVGRQGGQSVVAQVETGQRGQGVEDVPWEGLEPVVCQIQGHQGGQRGEEVFGQGGEAIATQHQRGQGAQILKNAGRQGGQRGVGQRQEGQGGEDGEVVAAERGGPAGPLVRARGMQGQSGDAVQVGQGDVCAGGTARGRQDGVAHDGGAVAGGAPHVEGEGEPVGDHTGFDVHSLPDMAGGGDTAEGAGDGAGGHVQGQPLGQVGGQLVAQREVVVGGGRQGQGGDGDVREVDPGRHGRTAKHGAGPDGDPDGQSAGVVTIQERIIIIGDHDPWVDAHDGRDAGDGEARAAVELQARREEVQIIHQKAGRSEIAPGGGRQDQLGNGEVHEVGLIHHGPAETRHTQIGQHHRGLDSDLTRRGAVVALDLMSEDGRDGIIVIVAADADGDRAIAVPVAGTEIHRAGGDEGVRHGWVEGARLEWELDAGDHGGDPDVACRPAVQPDAVGGHGSLSHAQWRGGVDGDAAQGGTGGKPIARLLVQNVGGVFGDVGEPAVEGHDRRGLGGDHIEGVAVALTRRDGDLATAPPGDRPGHGDVERGSLREVEVPPARALLIHTQAQRQRAARVAVQEERGQGGQVVEQALRQVGELVAEEAQGGQRTQVGEEGAGQGGQLVGTQVEVRQGGEAGEERRGHGAQFVGTQVEARQGGETGEEGRGQGAQFVGTQVEARQGGEVGEEGRGQGAQFVGTQVEAHQATEAGEKVGGQGAQFVGAHVDGRQVTEVGEKVGGQGAQLVAAQVEACQQPEAAQVAGLD